MSKFGGSIPSISSELNNPIKMAIAFTNTILPGKTIIRNDIIVAIFKFFLFILI